jgi:malonate transporter and related proteins
LPQRSLVATVAAGTPHDVDDESSRALSWLNRARRLRRAFGEPRHPLRVVERRMIAFVLLSLPVFGVVALGWAAVRLRLVAPPALDALGLFSFRFALPALVFRLIASQPLGRSFDPAFYQGYLASGCLVFALVFGLSLLPGRQAVAVAGARATTATVSNLGFLGPPLMLAFFGERGAGPLAMAILAEIMVLLSLGSVMMGASRGDNAGIGLLVLRGTVLNPVVAAIMLGAALAATGLPLPVAVDRFLGFLGGSAGPTALFALGGALAVQRIDRATAVSAAGITAVKLLIYPLVVWFVLARLLRIDAFWVQAGVLIAALPSAGNVYVLARRYDADAERVSAAIVLSTLVSVIAVPFAAWLMLR